MKLKRWISSLMAAVTVLVSLCGCGGGSFAPVGRQEPVAIPENGIIEKKIINQLKEDNVIGTFTGKSGDFAYEWTIFGSDVKEPRDVNLAVEIAPLQNHGGVTVRYGQTEPFGFPAVLSIHLNEKWNADSTTVYDANNTVVCNASVTQSETTILNYTVEKLDGTFTIRPDASLDASSSEASSSEAASSASSSQASSQKQDSYVSASSSKSDRPLSDGTGSEKDKYETDPVPAGKPLPVEPEASKPAKKETFTCTISIECSTILNNLDDLDPDKLEMVPSNGIILPKTQITVTKGESVFDVLQRVCKEKKIHMEYQDTPMYNSAYIEGIHNLYEFDCGPQSGWMYRVNGWYPNYGCSRYQLSAGEVIEWRYTCKGLGADIGGSVNQQSR